MPRLNRPIKVAAHESSLPFVCAYVEEQRGFEFAGNLSSYVLDILRRRARVVGQRDCASVWLLPEIYWHSVSVMYQHTKAPEIYKALSEFTALSRRYNEMVKPDEVSYYRAEYSPTGTVLRSYQREGIRALEKGSLLLADDMGTGKTLMMLMAWHNLRRKDPSCRLLVFTPNEDVADDWVNEGLKRHIGGNYCSKVIRNRTQLGGYADITLIPYTKIWRTDYDAYLRKLCLLPGTVLAMDEGHLCSAISSHQHKAAYEYAQLAERVWIATGTECRNPREYYGVYRIQRGLPPNHTTEEAWVKYYRDRSGYGWDEDKLKQLRVLRRLFAIRRTKSEVCHELPACTPIRIPCAMHPIQEELYRQMEKEKECEVVATYGNKELSETQFLTVYLRLMQLTSHPLNVEETRVDVTPKLEAILNILDGAGEQKVVVWSNWPKTIDYLHREIAARRPDLTIGIAHGGIDKQVRVMTKQAAQRGELDLVIANPKVWSTGINLQVFSICVRHDHHPSSVQWLQAIDRLHRMGQKLPVTDYHLYHPGTIELRILRHLTEKQRLSTIITGG